MADRTPTGGKSQNTGARGTFFGEIEVSACSFFTFFFWPPSSSPELCNLFTVCALADWTPRGSKSQIRGFKAILAQDGPLHLEKFWAENRKTKTATWRPKAEKQTPFSSVLIPSLVRLGSQSWDPLGSNRFTPSVGFWLGGSARTPPPPPPMAASQARWTESQIREPFSHVQTPT